MSEFSACYFCGTALDAPLAEYPVVPEVLHPSADQQRTVVLCPTCRRKLGAVVDAVVEAVDEAPTDESVQRDLSEAAGNGASDDGGESDDDVSVESVDDRAGETSDDAADAGGFEFAEESGAETAAPDADESDDSESSDDSVVEETQGEPTDVADEADDRMDEDDETDVEGEATDEPTDDDEPHLTALEYNKVMRLLQNREFPIDREEFKVVATNAYEIGDDEFDAIIDAAADRDLIGLEGGDIVES